jgi:hypothetical protein
MGAEDRARDQAYRDEYIRRWGIEDLVQRDEPEGRSSTCVVHGREQLRVTLGCRNYAKRKITGSAVRPVIGPPVAVPAATGLVRPALSAEARIRRLEQNPPASDWDGVFTAETK